MSTRELQMILSSRGAATHSPHNAARALVPEADQAAEVPGWIAVVVGLVVAGIFLGLALSFFLLFKRLARLRSDEIRHLEAQDMLDDPSESPEVKAYKSPVAARTGIASPVESDWDETEKSAAVASREKPEANLTGKIWRTAF